MALTDTQVERYSRQLLLEGMGVAGQEKLLASRVLIIGTGGLGSPAALYLTAAGVGTIGLVDGDRVDLSNLQRQIAHATPDLGRWKVDSAADKCRALNPDVTLRIYRERFGADNALALLDGYDFVIDGTDSFASKFLISDACHFAGKPYSHAGILRYEGQTLTVLPGQSGCYRCLFEKPPPPGTVPTCSQAGVLGVVAGLIGTLQAAEALRYLLGLGGLLTDRLLTLDTRGMRWREIPFHRNPECPLCGDHPTIRSLQEEGVTVCSSSQPS